MVRRFGSLVVLLAALLSMPLAAQLRPIEFGFKAGVPLGELVEVKGGDAARGDHSLPFTAGGALELNLPIGFAIEANALYKRPGYELGTLRERHSQWEFPVLLKGYLLGRNPVIQPYTGAGISFRHTGASVSGDGSGAVNRGLVLAAGVRNGPGRIKISPELRFTRWFGSTRLYSGLPDGRAETGKNQLELLVGVTF